MTRRTTWRSWAAYKNGANIAAREAMALASLFGGLTLANAKLGAVHGFAGPLGDELNAPHGTLCGRLLPYCINANWKALQERAHDSVALARLDEVATLITGRPKAKAADGIQWLHTLCHDLHTEPLSNLGLTDEAIPEMAQKAQTSSSMKGNPIDLTLAELEGILRTAL